MVRNSADYIPRTTGWPYYSIGRANWLGSQAHTRRNTSPQIFDGDAAKKTIFCVQQQCMRYGGQPRFL